MEIAEPRTVAARPQIRPARWADLGAALSAGWRDFRRAPAFGAAFAAVYVLGGLALWVLGAGMLATTIVLTFGFPLIAPFAAVGIYEVSRRLEAGQPLSWSEVAGVVWAERGRQIPWIGAALYLVFLFWSFFAHMAMALFLGRVTLVNVSTSWETFLTPEGLTMIAFELVVGAGVAFLVFTMTVVAIPMLLDRDVDVVTAMVTSFRTVGASPVVMTAWAALIAVSLLVAMLPLFLGLLVALPVLGHATWHLYRRLISYPE